MATTRFTAFALLLGASAALAQDPIATLVKDINTSGASPVLTSSSPGQLTAVGSKVFFFATEPSSGREVWVTDGTAAGTELLHDVDPGPGAGDHPWVGSVNNRFVWVAMGASGRRGLWASDGTRPGTAEVFPRSADLMIVPGFITIAGNRVFFLGCGSGGCSLWTSDGTVAGTRSLVRGPVFQSHLTPVGNRVFFLVLKSLWVSDGTTAGTHLVRDFSPADPSLPTPAGNRLFFLTQVGPDQRLWASDGTAGGTVQLTHFTQPYPFGLDTAFLRAAGSGVFFSASDPTHGDELWASDGTPAGTRRLTDFAAAHPFGDPLGNHSLAADTLFAAGSRPVFLTTTAGETRIWTASGGKATQLSSARVVRGAGFVAWNGKAFFAAGDGHSGQEPWVTDGTPQGTHRIADLCPGSCGSELSGFLARPRAVYFADRSDLWRTDGTAAGTQRLTTPAFFIGGISDTFDVAEVGSTVFVSSFTPYGYELWLHDGAGRTRLVTDVARSEPSSAPGDLTALGGRLLFTAAQNGFDRALWQSSAAADDVSSLSSPFQGTLGIPEEWGLIAAEGMAYYFFPDAEGLLQLWRTDGTAAGTVQILSLPQGVAASNRLPLTFGTRALFHGKLLFAAARDADTGVVEIWESDGTAAGTRRAPYLPADFVALSYVQTVGDELYFSAREADGSPGLWRSDGTVAGTHKISSLSVDQNPRFSRLGAAVFFIAQGPGSTWHLWRTDGTAEGTTDFLDTGRLADRLPVELAVSQDAQGVQGALYLFLRGGASTDTVWRSDGTPAGTAVLRSFPVTLAGGPAFHSPTSFADRLFFLMADAEHGTELWSTDGTAAGTALFEDIAPGPASSTPAGLTAVGNRLFFTAHDGEHGIELWTSDGTATGTRMVQDIAPEALSSSPDQLTAVGDRLYFTADDGLSGRELWSLPLTGAGGCQPSPAHLCLGGRYRVDAAWRTAQGDAGTGTAVPLSADTGYFWFFSAANVEAIVKVLDGQAANGHVWVFYGALSNVEYTLTVTDTQTGLTRRYFNPLDQLASVGDTHAFGPLGASAANPHLPAAITATTAPSPLVTERKEKTATIPCQASAQRLCLNGGRFAVDVTWKDFQGNTGTGTAVPLSGDSGTTGTFWFFSAANVELVVKALDGRPVNGHFWLFYGALSNVEYTLTVTDTQTGTMRTYTNPSGRFASVADTQAF